MATRKEKELQDSIDEAFGIIDSEMKDIEKILKTIKKPKAKAKTSSVTPRQKATSVIRASSVKPKSKAKKAKSVTWASSVKTKPKTKMKRIDYLKALAKKTGKKRVYKGKTIAELAKMLEGSFIEDDEEKEEARPPVGLPVGPPPPAPASRTIKELKNSLRKYNEENCEKLSGNKSVLLARVRKRGI
tara:strand:+ start:548 stop:1108 length:561 start_codon:yes stop_codon:yes gene_type:complete